MKRTSLVAAVCAVVCFASYACANADHPFDGAWKGTVAGESQSCAGSLDYNFTIAKSHISNENGSGVVSRNGAAHGTVTGGGFTATWSGHFTPTRGSGRFKRNDGCIGHWEARKI